MENEIWKDIPGWEGYYQASNFGRIRSLNYHNTGRVEILKQRIEKNKYARIGLVKNKIQKQYLVHRLVASAFIPNPDNLPEINHKNEDGTDNRVENLEWCTTKYNRNYGTCNQRIAKTKSKPVIQYDLEGNLVKEWESISAVQRKTGWNTSHISSCCRGRLKTMYNYVWRYK